MNKKVLIVNKIQYGYHTDTYKYTSYLKGEFDITYICFDSKLKKYNGNGIRIKYISNDGSFILRGFKFVHAIIKYILNNKTDLVFITYFQLASFLKIIFPLKKFILDIRTGSIANSWIKRKRYDGIMVLESLLFNNITIISDCLRIKLKLNSKKCHLLPLGSDIISKTKKSFNDLKIIYVGSFDNRNIHETIIGLNIFIQKYKSLKVTYDIFGTGSKGTEDLIKNTIEYECLNQIVKLNGRKNHNELREYFDNCNIGISYIPITDYYDCQPPTKTYEYINSGILCIATKTTANKELICVENGILCEDNPISFFESLEKIYLCKDNFNSEKIASTLIDFNWQNITDNLSNYLNNLLNK